VNLLEGEGFNMSKKEVYEQAEYLMTSIIDYAADCRTQFVHQYITGDTYDRVRYIINTAIEVEKLIKKD
jgi:hypothetical protein